MELKAHITQSSQTNGITTGHVPESLASTFVPLMHLLQQGYMSICEKIGSSYNKKISIVNDYYDVVLIVRLSIL